MHDDDRRSHLIGTSAPTSDAGGPISPSQDRPSAAPRSAANLMDFYHANRATILVVCIFLALIQLASLFFPPYLFPNVQSVFIALYAILITCATSFLQFYDSSSHSSSPS